MAPTMVATTITTATPAKMATAKKTDDGDGDDVGGGGDDGDGDGDDDDDDDGDGDDSDFLCLGHRGGDAGGRHWRLPGGQPLPFHPKKWHAARPPGASQQDPDGSPKRRR